MKKLLVVMSVSALALVQVSALAATSITDSEILAKVMTVDQNEIAAAATAEKKTISSDVMAYAKMLHAEHTKNQAKLMKFGMSAKMTPSDSQAVTEMKTKGADDLAKLSALDGKDFEKAYLDAMVKGHTDALAMLDNELIPSAKNNKLKQDLADTRSHVAMHLEQAKKLQDKS